MAKNYLGDERLSRQVCLTKANGRIGWQNWAIHCKYCRRLTGINLYQWSSERSRRNTKAQAGGLGTTRSWCWRCWLSSGCYNLWKIWVITVFWESLKYNACLQKQNKPSFFLQKLEAIGRNLKWPYSYENPFSKAWIRVKWCWNQKGNISQLEHRYVLTT